MIVKIRGVFLLFVLFCNLVVMAQEDAESKVDKPEFVDRPYLLIDDGELTSLEENVVQINKRSMIMTSSDVPSVVIPNKSSYRFIIDIKAEDITLGLVLYKIKPIDGGLGLDLKGRKALSMLEQSKVPINFKQISGTIYEIIPSTELEFGDYAFSLVMSSFVFRVE